MGPFCEHLTSRWARVHFFDRAGPVLENSPGLSRTLPPSFASFARQSGAELRPDSRQLGPNTGQLDASSQHSGQLRPTSRISRARGAEMLTVPAMTDPKVLARRQAAVARLGGFGAASATGGGSVLPLQVVRESVAAPARLPAGAAVRQADDKGRLKPGFARPLTGLLGWVDGALAAHLQGAWLVLTQPAELRGVQRIRNSPRAQLSAGVTERVCLSPAQRRAVLGAGGQVFLVPVPQAGALVVADPGAFFCAPPAAVTRLFVPTTDETLLDPGARIAPLRPAPTDS